MSPSIAPCRSPHSAIVLQHVLASIAQQVGIWEGLVPTVMSLAQSESEAVRAVAFFVLGVLCEFCSEQMDAHARELHEAFDAGMKDASLDVRVKAVTATVQYVATLNRDARGPFEALLSPMFGVLDAALTDGDELSAGELLIELTGLARTSATFLKPALEQIGQLMLQIAGADSLEPSSRKMAMELLLAVAESAPGMVRKCAPLIAATLPLAFRLMSEVEEDESWAMQEYNEMNSDGIDDVESCALVGEEAVFRLSRALQGNAILPVAFEILPGMLGDESSWQNRRAGLLGVGLLAEGCKKQMKSELQAVMDMVGPAMQDAHPRVRHAAITCIGTFAEDFSDSKHATFHKGFGDGVMSALALAMSEENGNPWRVRAHAATALVNFAKQDVCPPNMLLRGAEPLLQSLISMLGGPWSAQAQALFAVSAIARVLAADFSGFYDHFMPGLKGLLVDCADAPTHELRLVRGRAMECVGIIAQAVGRDQFLADAKEIMDTLLSAQSGGFDLADPQIKYVVEAGARVCQVLGDECVPYLPMLIPPLVAAARKDPGVSATQVDPDDPQAEVPEGMDSMTLELRGVGNIRFSMNTSVMEEITMATRTLFEYAEQLEGLFFPYVEDVASAVLPLISFKFNNQVRYSAACAAPRLLGAYITGLRDSGADTSAAMGLLEMALTPLLDALRDERDSDTRLGMAEALSDLLSVCRESGGGPDVPPTVFVPEGDAGVGRVVNVILQCFGESIGRREELAEQLAEDGDEEALDALAEHEEIEEELSTYLIDALGYLIKTMREAFIPVMDGVVAPMITPMIAEGVPAALRVNGLCPYVDMIEFGGEAATKYIAGVLPCLVAGINDEAPGVRQVCSYGFGVALNASLAECAGSVRDALLQMGAAVSREDAFDEDDRFASENVVSAIAKVLVACAGRPGVDEAHLWPLWLSKLPIQEDEQEAQYCHSLLCDQVEARNPHLLSGDPAQLGQVLNVFSSTLVAAAGGGDDSIEMADEETRNRMVGLCRSLHESFGAEAFGAAAVTLDEAQQGVLAEVMGAGL